MSSPTPLYERNSATVQQKLDSQEETFAAMQVEIQRLRATVQQLITEQAQTKHMVDTMWVKWMGHGATE